MLLVMECGLLDVQGEMGHTTFATTNHYTSLTGEHLQSSRISSRLCVQRYLENDEIGGKYWDSDKAKDFFVVISNAWSFVRTLQRPTCAVLVKDFWEK
jgi:hypothetical protein